MRAHVFVRLAGTRIRILQKYENHTNPFRRDGPVYKSSFTRAQKDAKLSSVKLNLRFYVSIADATHRRVMIHCQST